MANSILQGVISQPVDLAGAFSRGQQMYNSNQNAQLDQQRAKQDMELNSQKNQMAVSEAEYQKNLRKMQIANRLAKQAINLPPEGVDQLLNQYSNVLLSVGFTPDDLANTPRDKQGLQALIDQTESVLPMEKDQGYTLSEGETRFDNKGKVIASVKKTYNPQSGAGTSADIQEIEYYNRMPEGPAKKAAGIKLGMIPSEGLSPEAVELAADRLLKGEPSRVVLANFGRGAQGAADLRAVQNRLATKAIEQGIDATKLLQNTQNVYADNRTFLELGAREGKIASRVQEANLFADIALRASAEVQRDSFVPWNKLSQYTSKQLSDPKLAALHAATQSLVNAYASAVGGGVMTEGNRQEANRMLYDAQGPEAYNAVVNQMLVETQAALDSPKQVRKHMHGDTGHGKELTDEELLSKYYGH